MYVTFSEERQQQDTGDKYMSVYGTDRDGVDSGTIRFWGWNDTVNIQGGNTIVIRGLKVAPEYYCHTACRFFFFLFANAVQRVVEAEACY